MVGGGPTTRAKVYPYGVLRPLFQFAIFLNAFLLFSVQPLIAKRLLPIFGGSPLVWNTCLLFFQVVLLVGYLYAHWQKKLGQKRAPWIHVAMLALGALVLPIRVPQFIIDAYKSSQGLSGFHPIGQPAVALLLLLLLSVGLPFLILSAGAPLIQKWYAQGGQPDAENPYFLYRASNFGSIVALLTYPFLVEPRFTLTESALLWAGLYVLHVFLMLGLVYNQRHRFQDQALAEQVVVAGSRPTWNQRGIWILLAAGPSCLLLGASGYLTTNIAPLPLLWVAPLSLYLLSFILAFSDRFKPRLVNVHAFLILGTLALGCTVTVLSFSRVVPLTVGLSFFALFVFFYTGHYSLALSKPKAEFLTEFYVWISVGGALGGLFAAIVAPLIFNNLYEYIAGAALTTLAIALAQSERFKKTDWLLAALAGVGMIALYYRSGKFALCLYLAAGVLLVCVLRPKASALVATSVILCFSLDMFHAVGNVIYRGRSFFGARSVLSSGAANRLMNGNTLHGTQYADTPEKPTTYYTPWTGVGIVLNSLKGDPIGDQVAFVGLGAGTLAAYGWKGQTIDYYEIDPLVVQVAQNPRYFTFLRDTAANVNVVIGDARLQMERAAPEKYGAIVLDAFTSDAIPSHLLTKEAFDLYAKKLKPTGVLLVHISNRHLRLAPVVANTSNLVGFKSFLCRTKNADWMLLVRNKEQEDRFATLTGESEHKISKFVPSPLEPQLRPWTDDYTDILSILSLTGVER